MLFANISTVTALISNALCKTSDGNRWILLKRDRKASKHSLWNLISHVNSLSLFCIKLFPFLCRVIVRFYIHFQFDWKLLNELPNYSELNSVSIYLCHSKITQFVVIKWYAKNYHKWIDQKLLLFKIYASKFIHHVF